MQKIATHPSSGLIPGGKTTPGAHFSAGATLDHSLASYLARPRAARYSSNTDAVGFGDRSAI